MSGAALSPSRAGDFLSCPLLYRYRTIDRLPEDRSRWIKLRADANVAGDTISSMAIDDRDALWLGTGSRFGFSSASELYPAGVSQLSADRRRWQTFTVANTDTGGGETLLRGMLELRDAP